MSGYRIGKPLAIIILIIAIIVSSGIGFLVYYIIKTFLPEYANYIFLSIAVFVFIYGFKKIWKLFWREY